MHTHIHIYIHTYTYIQVYKGAEKFKMRLEIINNEVIYPRKKYMEIHKNTYKKEGFFIRLKHFVPLPQIRLIVEKITPQLTHENDGLILVPNNDPYKNGRDDKYLKWKPVHLNSIDFKLRYAKRRGRLGEDLWVHSAELQVLKGW